MERQCWICFSPETETPKGVRWVSPCKCLGDTRWVHEPCLFTWIIRQQTSRQQEGEPAAVLIHEDLVSTMSGGGGSSSGSGYTDSILPSASAADVAAEQAAITATELEVIQSRMRTRLHMLQDHGDRLIKCPQCHSPYEIVIEPRGFFAAALVDLYTIGKQVGDFLVPYVIVGGGTYVMVAASAAFGTFVIVSVVGGDDVLARHLIASRWSWREWVGIFGVPYYLALLHVRVGPRVAALAALTSFAACHRLNRDLSQLLDLHSDNDLQAVVAYRSYILLGLLGVKYSYNAFYTFMSHLLISTPSLPPSSASTTTSGGGGGDEFTSYLTADLVDVSSSANGPSNDTTLFAVGRSLSNAILLPIFSSLSGRFLKCSLNALLQSHTLDGHVSLQRAASRLVGMDHFMWTLLGGCSFTLVKDIGTLLFNRQRRQQRKRMRILNYRPIAS